MDQLTGGDPFRMMQNPTFRRLVAERSAFAWTLSIIMVVVYVGFILLVAFDRGLLAQTVGGGTTSVGILLGLAVIIIAFALTGIYVARANSRFDALSRTIAEESGQ